jgi:hypothetical protein
MIKILNFVRNLSFNTMKCQLPQDALQTISAASTFVELMVYFAWLMNEIYEGFTCRQSFELLDRAITNLVHSGLYSESAIHNCIQHAGIEVKATYRFQQYIFPTCLSLMDGNHRHVRVLVKEYINSNPEFVGSNSFDGYKLTVQGTNIDQTDSANEEQIAVMYEHDYIMNYAFYTMDKELQFINLTRDEREAISRKQNSIIKNSLCKENCHR